MWLVFGGGMSDVGGDFRRQLPSMIGMAGMFVATIFLAMFIRPWYDKAGLQAFGEAGASQLRYIGLELIMIFIASVLLIIAILLIYNTIRLAVFSKRFMIRTMQLVGAKSYFIRRPFIYRAFYQGFISGLLAILFLVSLWYSFTYINPSIIISLSSESVELIKEVIHFVSIAAGILIVGVLVSVISTYFALNKFIWVKSEKLY